MLPNYLKIVAEYQQVKYGTGISLKDITTTFFQNVHIQAHSPKIILQQDIYILQLSFYILDKITSFFYKNQ